MVIEGNSKGRQIRSKPGTGDNKVSCPITCRNQLQQLGKQPKINRPRNYVGQQQHHANDKRRIVRQVLTRYPFDGHVLPRQQSWQQRRLAGIRMELTVRTKMPHFIDRVPRIANFRVGNHAVDFIGAIVTQ